MWHLCDIFGSAREEQGDVKNRRPRAKIKKGGQVIKEDNVSPLLDYHEAVIIFMVLVMFKNLNKPMKNY